ncbi:MAG: hypothetical protein TREMPRED_005263 [Tremellales sp. Tagirdzhanova-0007]|nr:MAG: hypothetical protein TREMPRED_005263 [Tremellales sp. Tagirdzhanova-0007]
MSWITRFLASALPLSALSQQFPPPSLFSIADIPNLSDKVIMVTGGNTGIGYAICSALLKHDATVYLTSRSEERGKEAVAKLKGETGNEAILLQLDTSDLSSVQSAASDFLKREDHLDVLFENAGVCVFDLGSQTRGAVDLTFATNVLGHSYLDKLLLPALENTLKITGHKARIVITSTVGLKGAPQPNGIDFSTLMVSDPTRAAREKLGGLGLYSQSKMVSHYISSCPLRVEYRATPLTFVTSLHPGGVQSGAFKHAPPSIKWIVDLAVRVFFHPAEQGALTPLYAGVSPETADAGGRHFVPWAREATAALDKRALNEETQELSANWMAERIEDDRARL